VSHRSNWRRTLLKLRCNLLKRIIQTWNQRWSKSAMIRVKNCMMNSTSYRRSFTQQNYTFSFSLFLQMTFLKIYRALSSIFSYQEKDISLYGRKVVGISIDTDQSEICAHKTWPHPRLIDGLFLAWSIFVINDASVQHHTQQRSFNIWKMWRNSETLDRITSSMC